MKTMLTLCLALFTLAACTTDQQNKVATFQANPTVQATEKAAGKIAHDFLVSAAQTEVNGGKINSAWAMSAGLNSISDVVSSLPNSQASQVIIDTAQGFSADPSTKSLAQKLAAAYVAANPTSPAQKTATVVALATGLQNGTQTATAALP